MSEQPQLTPEQQKNIKKGKRTLLAILLASALPVVAAYVAFFTGVGVPTTTVNQGELLPEPLSTESLVSQSTWEEIGKHKKWRIFIPLALPCMQDCEDILYTTRQVHTRLGEKAARLERYVINLSGLEGEQYLADIQQQHPLLKFTTVEPAHWQVWIDQSPFLIEQASRPYYLLVDQEGFAMMHYRQQHGNDLLADIKRALKYSIDYQ